jgi:LmbE family N-acetylglucosaminyl deacetylase/fucose permease
MGVRPGETAAFGGMFLFGIVMALLGAVLPVVSTGLGLDLAAVGNLFLAMNAAILVCSFVLGPVLDRFGFRGVLSLGPLLIALGLALVAGAQGQSRLFGAVVLLGMGGSALNSATNTLVADLHADPQEKAAALNRLGVFFGFGALLLPFLIGSTLETLGLGAILLGAATLSVMIAAFSAAVRFPPGKQAGFDPREALPVLRHPLVLVLGALLFFQSGNEFLLGGYLTLFLTRDLGASFGAASYVLAAYWAALMIARTLLGRVLARVPASRLVPVLAASSAAAVALAAVAPTFALAATAMIAAGLALAGIFPTVLGIAGGRLPSRSGTVFGVLFTIALCGGMTIPWLAGHIAARAGLRAVLVLGALGFVAVMLLAWRAGRLAVLVLVLAGPVVAADRTILVVGAHAGDAEITTGAILARHHRQGDRVVILHLTLGESGNPKLDPAAYGEQKRREALEAAKALGAEALFAPYQDGLLVANDESARHVADVIRQVRPTHVITHWRSSIHKDHVAAHRIVNDAVLLASIPGFTSAHPPHRGVRAVYYAENWEDAEGFGPYLFVDVTEDLPAWKRAVSAYEFVRGGISAFPYLEYYEALARVRGAEAGRRFAVALEVDPLAKKQVLDALP